MFSFYQKRYNYISISEILLLQNSIDISTRVEKKKIALMCMFYNEESERKKESSQSNPRLTAFDLAYIKSLNLINRFKEKLIKVSVKTQNDEYENVV